MYSISYSFYFYILTVVFEWGVIIFEFIFAINIISGGTVIETFKDPCSRRVLATMIRETSEVLSVVSRSSKWKPSMELVSWMLTPWLLEMILCLPYYFIYLISFVTCLPLLSVPSVGQTDLLEGRSCVDTQSLLDLITVCILYYDAILLIV